MPWAPPIRSKKGPIRSKTWEKKDQNGPFWGVAFPEVTFSNSSLD